MISNEHPENFERYRFDPDLARRVELGAHEWLAAAATMHVTARPGTDLTVGWRARSSPARPGSPTGPGSIAHWPGGLVLAFPAAARSTARSCSRPAT